MTEPALYPATTLPPPSPDGDAQSATPTPSAPTTPAPTTSAPSASAPSASVARPPRREPLRSRIGQARTALIAGAVVLILVLIFIIENAHAVTISYFGAHLRMSLAVALLLAAIAGALVMAAVGTARITQLRLSMRRGRRQHRDG